MSNNNSNSFPFFGGSTFKSSSYSWSFSADTTVNNGIPQISSQRASAQGYTDPSGNTTVRVRSQRSGEPERHEERRFDSYGRELIEDGAGGVNRRITEVGEVEGGVNRMITEVGEAVVERQAERRSRGREGKRGDAKDNEDKSKEAKPKEMKP